MLKHTPRHAALALGLAAAALAGTASPSAAIDPCDRADPPEWCTDNPPPFNAPPQVSIGAGKTTVNRGEAVRITGSASDAEDGAVPFAYDVDGDGRYGEHADEAAFDVSWPTAGERTVRIAATDSGGKTATKSVTIKVVNRAPTVRIEGPTTLLTGETGTWRAVTSDPDGDPVSIAWGQRTCNDIPNGEGNGPTASFTAPAEPSDRFAICAMVTDGQGMYAGTGDFHVRVVNRKPVAALSFLPAAPVAGETVTFDSAGSSDADGTIASRAWDTNGDGAFDDGTGVTAQRTYAAAGTYAAAVEVTDDRGDTTVRTVDVVVVPKPATGGGTTGGGATGGGTTGGGTTGGGTTGGTGTGTGAGAGAGSTGDGTGAAGTGGVAGQGRSGPAANASALKVKLTRRGAVRTFKLTGATGTVAVACKGKGCGFRTRSVTTPNLKSLFRKRLRKGTTVTVVTGDGTTTARRTFTIKVAKAGKAKVTIA